MNYIIYSLENGEIKQCIQCDCFSIENQYDSKIEGYLIGEIDSFNYFVHKGALFPFPPRVSEHHVFNYITKQWEDPRTPETEWPLILAKRNELLSASDWTQLPDVPISTKEVWANYRQALRDITKQPEFPIDVIWPEPPA